MKGWRTWAAAIIACAGFVPLQSAAQNLVTNGSFEGGSLAGWTPVESGPFSPGNCVFESDTAGTATGGFAGFTTPPPTDGTFVYMTDANQPGTCRIYQDIVVPADQSYVTATFAAGYNVLLLGGTGAGCSASIDITTPTASFTPLANLWSRSGGTSTPFGNAAPRPVPVTPGSTIRLVLTAVSCTDGPAGIAVDNLVLVGGSNVVPTLDDWAKAALALLLVVSAALQARRRSSR